MVIERIPDKELHDHNLSNGKGDPWISKKPGIHYYYFDSIGHAYVRRKGEKGWIIPGYSGFFFWLDVAVLFLEHDITAFVWVESGFHSIQNLFTCCT